MIVSSELIFTIVILPAAPFTISLFSLRKINVISALSLPSAIHTDFDILIKEFVSFTTFISSINSITIVSLSKSFSSASINLIIFVPAFVLLIIQIISPFSSLCCIPAGSIISLPSLFATIILPLIPFMN